jgi:2,5-diketo-D-gluconate reductase B
LSIGEAVHGHEAPRTTDPLRIASNLRVFYFALTATEIAAIHALAEADSRIVSPPGLSPVWDATPAAERAIG